MQIPPGLDPAAIEVVPLKAPVLVLRVKIETVLVVQLGVYTLAPSAEMQMSLGPVAVAIVVVPLKAPVLVLRVKILAVLLFTFVA